MHIVCCIKQVPDTTQVKIDPATNTLIRAGVESICNPYDLVATEAAVKLVEKYGGKVTVISMGIPQAEAQLRDCLAIGANEAVLLSDRALAGADTLATSYTLASAISRLSSQDPVEIVMCGKQAIDGDTGQVGPGIANQLGIPQLTYVSRVRLCDPAARRIVVERLLEEGHEVVASTLPALLTVMKDINVPRYPSLRGLRAARRAEIPVWTPADLPGCDVSLIGLDGSPTRVVRVYSPPPREERAVVWDGNDPQAAAAALCERLVAERVIG